MPTRDLSHPIEDGMPVYPGDPPVSVEPAATIDADGYRVTELTVPTHAGTHIDAPAHLLADGNPLEAYPLETFRFTARRVDCRGLDPRQPIDADALRAITPSEDVDLLVVDTGWDDHWGTDAYLEHPYLTEAAAEVILEWDVHVGIDAPNVDPTPTARARADEPDGYPVHHTLFADGRLILENLRGFSAVPTRFDVHAYPLALEGDGSPVRAVAIW
ncbi:cyclase family protein [Natrialbaceae archaeon A-gly3]